MTPEYLYRFDDVVCETGVHINRRRFKVIKETPCGYWILRYGEGFPNDKKWVSKITKKRFAYPTAEEAKHSFIARKKRQIQILTSQLERAKIALIKADTSESQREGGRWYRWFR